MPTTRMSLADRLELFDAIALYNVIADRNDVEGYLDCFADDGRLLIYVPWQETPIVDAFGKDALRAAMTSVLATREKPVKIFQSYPVVEEVDATTLRTITQFLGFWPRTKEEPPSLRYAAWYVDVWVRLDGRWRIRERREQPSSVRVT